MDKHVTLQIVKSKAWIPVHKPFFILEENFPFSVSKFWLFSCHICIGKYLYVRIVIITGLNKYTNIL